MGLRRDAGPLSLCPAGWLLQEAVNQTAMISSSEREAALLAMAQGKPISGREAWLQAVCGEDHPLRQRLTAQLTTVTQQTPCK